MPAEKKYLSSDWNYVNIDEKSIYLLKDRLGEGLLSLKEGSYKLYTKILSQ